MTYKWHEAYRSAILETNWANMEERIRAAESAINARRHELSLDHCGTPEERQAIEDAINGLNALHGEVASWSRRKPREENPGSAQKSL